MYALSAVNNFYKYKHAVASNLEFTMDHFHFLLKNEFYKDWIKLTASSPQSDDESLLKVFEIFVDQKALSNLDENLPLSGKNHYVGASMRINNEG